MVLELGLSWALPTYGPKIKFKAQLQTSLAKPFWLYPKLGHSDSDSDSCSSQNTTFNQLSLRDNYLYEGFGEQLRW